MQSSAGSAVKWWVILRPPRPDRQRLTLSRTDGCLCIKNPEPLLLFKVPQESSSSLMMILTSTLFLAYQCASSFVDGDLSDRTRSSEITKIALGNLRDRFPSCLNASLRIQAPPKRTQIRGYPIRKRMDTLESGHQWYRLLQETTLLHVADRA